MEYRCKQFILIKSTGKNKFFYHLDQIFLRKVLLSTERQITTTDEDNTHSFTGFGVLLDVMPQLQ